jgi:hypothetical protein
VSLGWGGPLILIGPVVCLFWPYVGIGVIALGFVCVIIGV